MAKKKVMKKPKPQQPEAAKDTLVGKYAEGSDPQTRQQRGVEILGGAPKVPPTGVNIVKASDR
jgi:hypothetical protein